MADSSPVPSVVTIGVSRGATSWRCSGGTCCASDTIASGTTVTPYGGSPGLVRGTGIENESPALTFTAVLKPGPPWKIDGRDTVIVAGTLIASQIIGGKQYGTTRPVNDTGPSSTRPWIRP